MSVISHRPFDLGIQNKVIINNLFRAPFYSGVHLFEINFY